LRRARWQVPVVLAFGVAVWAFLSVAAIRHGFFDLSVYYGAVQYWAEGHDIYGYVRQHAEYGFTYPPFAALTMLPMAFVGWQVAVLVSVVLSLLATGVVLYWMVDPIARRQGWSRWFALAIAAGLAAAYEPMRETVNFGQVNMLLVVLVLADLMLLVRPGRGLGGIGIGLATAIKLTPGIFVLYLLVTRRFRAAALAAATATGATLLAAVVAPDESRVFWTDAMWDTDRIGALSYISNQSLRGAVARLGLASPWSTALFGVLVLAVLAVWVRRVRAARAAGDELAGYTFTAILACLASPFTWVHHLVWIMPAFALLVGEALAPSSGRRRRKALLAFAVAGYALLCSRLVWHFDRQDNVFEEIGSDAYALFCVALLVALRVRGGSGGRQGEPQLGDLEPAGDGVRRAGAVGDEAVPQVEAPGPLVPVERP
jgi:alpha-1,2-mannosyltransferase